jgi:C-1 hydroxylase
MSLEKNKAIIRRMIEAFNKRDLASLDKLIAADYIDHYHQLRSLKKYKQFGTRLLRAFPDWHEDVEDLVAEGNKVCLRFKATGKHTGRFEFGKVRLAPTGKKITGTGVLAYRIANGKIAEAWGASNLLEIYEKLGVIEYTEKAKGTGSE